MGLTALNGGSRSTPECHVLYSVCARCCARVIHVVPCCCTRQDEEEKQRKELEFMLEENKRKIEEAQRRAEQAQQQEDEERCASHPTCVMTTRTFCDGVGFDQMYLHNAISCCQKDKSKVTERNARHD